MAEICTEAQRRKHISHGRRITRWDTVVVGDKIWFEGESHHYTVRARSYQHLICTKPFNVRHTVLYTIVDVKNMIRGTEDLVFGMGAETDEQCKEMLARLEFGQSEISTRNRVDLKMTDIRRKI